MMIFEQNGIKLPTNQEIESVDNPVCKAVFKTKVMVSGVPEPVDWTWYVFSGELVEIADPYIGPHEDYYLFCFVDGLFPELGYCTLMGDIYKLGGTLQPLSGEIHMNEIMDKCYKNG